MRLLNKSLLAVVAANVLSASAWAEAPVLEDIYPRYSAISEDQVFALQFSQLMDPESIVKNISCVVSGVGEQIPVRIIDGEDRKQLFAANYSLRWLGDTDLTTLVQCSRSLPTGGSVSIVASNTLRNSKGVATARAFTNEYEVRQPFMVDFTCERVNANASCSPLGKISLSANSYITAEQLANIEVKINNQVVLSDAAKNNEVKSLVDWIEFSGPFPAKGELQINVPESLTDDTGRPLANAGDFPLNITFDNYPPLLKFATGNFGIIERYAESAPGAGNEPALIPLTVRNIEKNIALKGLTHSAQVSQVKVEDDVQVRRWLKVIPQLEYTDYSERNIRNILEGREVNYELEEDEMDTRNFSVLAAHKNATKYELPSGIDAANETEVIGLPITEKGFYVIEAESRLLGEQLTESENTMYVRTAALVTNLAVHLKKSEEGGALVWVTRLSDAQVVPDADVRLLSCDNKVIASGKTNQDGVFVFNGKVPEQNCHQYYSTMASATIPATHPLADGSADYSFVFSDWNDGIESWQFNVSEYFYRPARNKPTLVIHPVLSRTLLRAGETVHMKHFVRVQSDKGLSQPTPQTELPNVLVLTLPELDEDIEIPIKWQVAANGNYFAETKWDVPKNVKNGTYQLDYRRSDDAKINIRSRDVSFRVEEFKLPFLDGSIQLSSANQEAGVLINPSSMTANIQINYISGGPASELPIEVSAVYLPSEFSAPDIRDVEFSSVHDNEEEDESVHRKVFLDKKEYVLDGNGNISINIGDIPAIAGKADLLVEVSFLDPNGQVQTISQTVSALSSATVVGIRSASYFEPNKDFTFDVLSVNPLGEPKANANVTVNATRTKHNVVRKRLVGGYYTYDSHVTTEDLGELCSGQTDSYGILKCTVQLKDEGHLSLSASSKDSTGVYTAFAPLWIFKGASWYTGNDTDRIDVITDKKVYQVGEEVVFDVRAPFKKATALVGIEREGIVDYRVVEFDNNDATFKLKVEPDWAPNVFVTVLAVRERLYGDANDAGVAWLQDETHSKGASMLIDLAKPSFRFGVAKVKVENPDNKLNIALNLNKPVYQVREKVKLNIDASLANGTKAANANVAVFVVDKALLALWPNNTTDLFTAMYPERVWEVHTATAQGEVVGRRHYGRKAVPAGGGGGLAPTRELFDALVFWKADVTLDANGTAAVEFPLNDSITQFEVVAVGDFDTQIFGTQKAEFVSRQDLQIISGLPLMIRDTDKFNASLTLRNATERELKVTVSGSAKKGHREVVKLEPKELTLQAERSHLVSWPVEPLNLSDTEDAQKIDWVFEVKESVATPGTRIARDRINVVQQLIPYVPVTVRNTQLVKVDSQSSAALKLQAPTRALTVNDKIRGGIQVQLQRSLGASLSGVQRFFREYQFVCFEQQASVAMGLQNAPRWDALMQEVGGYMDSLGFLRYYPSNRLTGSPLLNAYILSIAADADRLGWNFAIPQQTQQQMLSALESVVVGKIKSRDWSPSVDRSDYDLTLIAALARYNLVKPSMLENFSLRASYSLSGWVNLYIIHSHMGGKNKATNLKTIRDAILAKLANQGDRYAIKDTAEVDRLWWMMEDSKGVLAKLVLHVTGEKTWEKDVPLLVQGLMQTQSRGQWGMTTNNLWGTLAMHRFTQVFEKTPASGVVNMNVKGGGYAEPQEWNGIALNQRVTTPWLDKKEAELQLKLEGKGTAWATISSLAAVEPVENVYAGYRVEKVIEPVRRRLAGQWSVGDVYRVKIKITADAPMTWVVLSDPIPSGATILGSGLGRDSAILSEPEGDVPYYSGPSFVERKSDVYRAYYHFVRKGETELQYTVRLNNIGKFNLPATRVEAMYAPAVFGETVNTPIQVKEP